MCKRMTIDEKQIRYLEDLSFLTLSPEERARICADLENIISGMAQLSSLDTSDMPLQAAPRITDLRRDEVTPSLPREEILRNAPQANGEAFVAPAAVE